MTQTEQGCRAEIRGRCAWRVRRWVSSLQDVATRLGKGRQAARRGFSLIEVNMAIFVLAGGIFALMSLFPLGLRESAASRNEMRIAAFAERLLGAAQMAAADPEVTDVDALAAAIEEIAGIKLDDDPGEYKNAVSAEKDTTSGVYYHAWCIDESSEYGGQNDGMAVAQIGVQVTAENTKQNRSALKTAPVYVIRVAINRSKP